MDLLWKNVSGRDTKATSKGKNLIWAISQMLNNKSISLKAPQSNVKKKKEIFRRNKRF